MTFRLRKGRTITRGYEMQKNHCKSSLFAYGCTSQGLKHSLFCWEISP